MARWDRLWVNASLATMVPGPVPYGAISDGAVAALAGRIVFVGPRSRLPNHGESALAAEVIDCRGGWITPGLIDCHTHLVFAGNRADEFERRLAGAGYEELASTGSGILATVAATRAAGEDELYALAMQRLAHWVGEGVTTIEIKSGYGLTVVDELKILRVIRRIRETATIDVRATVLAAHAVPAEFRDDPDAYVSLVCEQLLPEVARQRLAEFADVFCERIAFNPAQTRRVLECARTLKLGLKVHADQLSFGSGAELAAVLGVVSADHLEHLSAAGAAALRHAGVVAVLLPGASHFLRSDRRPPVHLLREHRVPMAVATDFNPGSSPLVSIVGAMNLACVLYGLTPEESVAGATREAARALGLGHDRGLLVEGMRADLTVWSCRHPRELAYWLGGTPGIIGAWSSMGPSQVPSRD